MAGNTITEKEAKKAAELEERKVVALEKLATSLDILTLWFEEIDKEDWDNRLQFYLNEFHQNIVGSKKTEASVDEE
ncbi:MAG: hypothetical protein ACO3LG_03930 [Ilumatobacteraceae bacterium]